MIEIVPEAQEALHLHDEATEAKVGPERVLTDPGNYDPLTIKFSAPIEYVTIYLAGIPIGKLRRAGAASVWVLDDAHSDFVSRSMLDTHWKTLRSAKAELAADVRAQMLRLQKDAVAAKLGLAPPKLAGMLDAEDG